MKIQGRKAMKNQSNLIIICKYTSFYITKLISTDVIFPPSMCTIATNTSHCTYSAAKYILYPLEKHLYKNNTEGKIRTAAN